MSIHVPVTIAWLNKHYVHYQIFLIFFYINDVFNILFVKAKYESHQVSVFKHFTFIPK